MVEESLNPNGVHLADAKDHADFSKKYALLLEYMEELKNEPESARLLVSLTPEELPT